MLGDEKAPRGAGSVTIRVEARREGLKPQANTPEKGPSWRAPEVPNTCRDAWGASTVKPAVLANPK